MVAMTGNKAEISVKPITIIKIDKLLMQIVFTDTLIFLFIELLKCYNKGIESVINIVPDFLSLISVCMLMGYKRYMYNVRRSWSAICAVLFVAWVTLTAFFPEGSIIGKYQRYRYIFIGFSIYCICTNFMTSEWWEKYKNFLLKIQVIHIILATYQFITMHVGVDRTNGIFGFIEYNNAANGVFCLVISMIGVESFLRNDKERIKATAMILMSCYACAIAEIKAFYVLLLIGAFLIVLFNSKDIRTTKRILSVAIIGIVGGILAFVILLKIMPENLYAFSSVDKWVAYESYETKRAGGMGRATQLQWIYNNVYQGDMLSALLGKGPGADVSIVAYEIGKVFWNFGLVGLISFLLFLIFKACEMIPLCKKSQEAMVCFVMCLLTIPCMVVWNATLNRTAMFLFVFLAVGVVSTFKEGQEK